MPNQWKIEEKYVKDDDFNRNYFMMIKKLSLQNKYLMYKQQQIN